MSAGGGAGTDTEGRAYDAGPTGQNVSAASIGQAQGYSGLEAVEVGLKELSELDDKHGTNFEAKALGLTGNNSIGVSELNALGFDPTGPVSSAQLAALDTAMFDPTTMMSDLGWGSERALGWDYDKAKRHGINFDPKIMSPTPPGGWMAPLGAALSLSLMDGKLATGAVSPSVNPHEGMEPMDQTDGDRLGGVWQAWEEINKEVEQLNPWEAVIDRITPTQVTPGFGLGNLYDKEGWGHINKNSVNPHLGFGLNPLDLDNTLGWNPAKVSTNVLPASIEPSVEQMLEWNPPQFDTNFNTNIPNPALSPEARKSDPGAANKALDAMGYGPLSQMDQDVLGLDRAMVSTDPWGGSVTSSISHSDTEREYAERAAAERALYSQIANQITQAASQSSGRQAANAPEARPVVIPAGTQAANAPAPVRHDPIANLVRTVLSPKINQVNPAAVKAIKKGKKPDYTMMSNYQQDLVRNILNPPKPPVSSNYSSIANR